VGELAGEGIHLVAITVGVVAELVVTRYVSGGCGDGGVWWLQLSNIYIYIYI